MATVTGTSGGDNLQGFTTADQILGFQGQDTLAGNGGDDTIFGGQGADTIAFGIGNNAGFNQAGANGSSYVVGGEGSDTITSLGGTGSNTVVGGTGTPSVDSGLDGADRINLLADQGRDLVLGNYGDDSIGIGRGGGSVFGGQGSDVIVDSGSTLLLGEGGGTTLGSANDVIFGGEGADTIDVSAFGTSSIVGGTGNASIDVSADGADYIFFDDRAEGANGNALIGNDLVLGNFGDDTIDAYGYFDGTGQARGGSDTLVGGQGDDLIFGGEQTNNIILGNEGNDIITNYDSESGNDTVYGGQGDDSIEVGDQTTGFTPNELVYGGEGNDFLATYGVGNDTLFGGVDSTGGSADGANAFDLTYQTSGNDLIFGGPNADEILIGRTDVAATVTGGAGADTVSFFPANQRAAPAADNGNAFNGSALDAITDFESGTDKINDPEVVTGVDIISGPITGGDAEAGANAALAAARDVNNGGVNAALFQTVTGGDHYLAIDNDANGAFDAGTDLLIDLKATASISASDFVSAATVFTPPPEF